MMNQVIDAYVIFVGLILPVYITLLGARAQSHTAANNDSEPSSDRRVQSPLDQYRLYWPVFASSYVAFRFLDYFASVLWLIAPVMHIGQALFVSVLVMGNPGLPAIVYSRVLRPAFDTYEDQIESFAQHARSAVAQLIEKYPAAARVHQMLRVYATTAAAPEKTD